MSGLHGTEHKTTTSYVVGFILSLVFTLIPYYLVVYHIVLGTALLITILSFAFAQLLVQVIFFLHLGRGPKPKWQLYFFIATVGAILVVVVGSIIIIHNLHSNMAAPDQTRRLVDNEGIYQVGGELTGACQGRHTNHRLTIVNGKIDPTQTIAARCDTLTFVNKDSTDLEVTFGTRERHAIYAGLSSFALRKEHTNTITLSELGSYQFHDKQRPELVGKFAVFDNN